MGSWWWFPRYKNGSTYNMNWFTHIRDYEILPWKGVYELMSCYAICFSSFNHDLYWLISPSVICLTVSIISFTYIILSLLSWVCINDRNPSILFLGPNLFKHVVVYLYVLLLCCHNKTDFIQNLWLICSTVLDYQRTISGFG